MSNKIFFIIGIPIFLLFILFGQRNSMLIGAAQTGSLWTLHLADWLGADPNLLDKEGNSLLVLAIQNDHMDVLKELIGNGADPNVCDAVTGKTPLMVAAEKGSAEAAQILLAGGADKTMRDDNGHNAAWHAWNNNFMDLKDLLSVQESQTDYSRMLKSAAREQEEQESANQWNQWDEERDEGERRKPRKR